MLRRKTTYKILILAIGLGAGFSACSTGSVSLPGHVELAGSDVNLDDSPAGSTPPIDIPSNTPPIDSTPTVTPTITTPTAIPTPGELPDATQAELPQMPNVVPNLLVFEKRTVGGNHSLNFVVSNGGSEDLTLQSVTAPSSTFQISGFAGATVLSPGEELTLTARFAPASTGTFTGLVSLNFAELAQPKTVEVWGAGVSSIPINSISGCGVSVNVAGATYQLQNDISAAGSCLIITAPNVTLDLQGHTIRYATSSGSPKTCDASGVQNVNCGILVNAPGSVIKNGSIVQGAGGASRDHAIYFGGGAHYSEMTGLTIDVSSTSSSNIAANDRKGFHIHHNTLISHVVRTDNSRSSIEDGTLIHLGYNISGGEIVRHSIHDNVMRGGLQAVINIYSTGSQIYRNDMSHEGILTNDFAIFMEGSNTEVFQNNIHPIDGRGIHLVGHDQVIRDNIIEVTELPQSCDISYSATPPRTYENCVPGCQSQGTYGIQMEGNGSGTSTVNALIYGNTITARADQCEALGMRISEIHGSNHKIFNNTFEALRAPGSSKFAAALSFDDVTDQFGSLIQNNLIVSDHMGVHFGYSGGNEIRFNENIFQRGPNAGSDFFLLKILNGPDPVSNIQFIDSQFGSGVDPQKTNWWRLDNDYLVGWTLDLTVQNGVGQMLNGAQVVIRDSTGNTAFTGTTSNGRVSAVLTQFRKVHTGNATSDATTTYTPHTITITPSGGSAYAVPGTITMNGTKSLTVTVP